MLPVPGATEDFDSWYLRNSKSIQTVPFFEEQLNFEEASFHGNACLRKSRLNDYVNTLSRLPRSQILINIQQLGQNNRAISWIGNEVLIWT